MTSILPITGKATWTDYQDNWRAADAKWLENRTVQRFTSTPGSTDVENGSIYYIASGDNGALYWKDKTGTSHALISPIKFNVVDTGGSTVALGYDGSTVISMTGSTVTLGSGPVLTVGADVQINTGGAVTLTTSSTALIVDKSVTATGFSTSGTVNFTGTTNANIVSASTVTTTTLSGNTSILGAATATSLSSGTISVGSNISLTGSTGAIAGTTLTVGNLGLASSTISNGSAASISIASALALVADTFTIKTNGAGAVAVSVAGVVIGGTGLNASLYPAGTLWIQT
jgi:hypothetical protein